MKRKELKEALIEIYACGPEVETVRGLIRCFEETADVDENIPKEEAVQAMCEQLVVEGILQRAGRKGFEATTGFMIERNLV